MIRDGVGGVLVFEKKLDWAWRVWRLSANVCVWL